MLATRPAPPQKSPRTPRRPEDSSLQISPRTAQFSSSIGSTQNFEKSTTLKNTNNLIRPELNQNPETKSPDFLTTLKLYQDVDATHEGKLYSPRVTPHTISPRFEVQAVSSMSEKAFLGKSNKNYKGYIPHYKTPVCRISEPLKKEAIIGYGGHIHGLKDGCGERFQVAYQSSELSSSIPRHAEFASTKLGIEPDRPRQRSFDETPDNEIDLRERYDRAIARVEEAGFNQEYLLSLVQSKLTDTITMDSQLTIKTRNMYNKLDVYGDGLSEFQFWKCLEKLNVQLKPDQATALFALFDEDLSGRIEWCEFEKRLLISHPTGGTTIFPKIVIGMTRNE